MNIIIYNNINYKYIKLDLDLGYLNLDPNQT